MDIEIDLNSIELQQEEVQPLGEHNPVYLCVKTDSFPLLKQPYTHYNPMQSDFLRAFRDVDWDGNIVVSSPTSSGKTTVAEIGMAIANNRKEKGIVLVPLRALAQEKYEDWTSLEHSFFDLNVVILTGDYSQDVTEKQLNDAHIIIMTSEALDHRSRFMGKNPWLNDVGMVVVDESHLLSLGTRGDRLETCLMRFTKYNTNARIALLSATMPNVDELKVWLENITGKPTVLVTSDYRPCKLEHQYVYYDEPGWKQGGWDAAETMRMNLAVSILQKYTDDKFIVFTGGKRWGRQAVEYFNAHGINSEFISADNNKDDRISLVNRFKDGDTRVLISSSLLAYGLNLPARRVVVAHVKRGRINIDTCDLIQMAGRAGRPKYDDKGTVYFLVPSSDAMEQKRRIEKGERIVSQLNNVQTLKFHVVAEVYNKEIVDAETLRDWYARSFASIQTGHISLEDAQQVLDSLEKIYMIKKREGTDNRYEITDLGKVCAWYYFSPDDVYSRYMSFNTIFKHSSEINDYMIAWAFANTSTWRDEYVSKAEKETTLFFVKGVTESNAYITNKDYRLEVQGGVEKWGACVFKMLQGIPNRILSSLETNIGYDMERHFECLRAIDSKFAHWNKKSFFDELYMRLKYKVTADKVELVRVKWIGTVLVEKMFARGIKNIDDLLDEDNIVEVKSMLGKRYNEAIESARSIKGGAY